VIVTARLDEKRPSGRRFGALVHAMLASIDLGASAEAVQASAAVHGRMFAATQEEIQAAITTVDAALQHPIIVCPWAVARRVYALGLKPDEAILLLHLRGKCVFPSGLPRYRRSRNG
jgi:hypothetical protein